MRKLLLFVALTISPLLSISGQETIAQLMHVGGKETIIREIDSSQWIVYSSSDSPIFSWVSNASAIVNEIVLPAIFTSVTDFDILGESVYFCGYDNLYMPVVGYFDYTALNPQIDYFNVTGVNELKKVKNLYPYLRDRLVLIGTYYGLPDQLIYAIHQPSSWDVYNIILKTDSGYYSYHDDMAIIDNYIVLTSRLMNIRNDSSINDTADQAATSYEEGRIWYVKFPYISAGSTLNSDVFHRKLSYSVSKPFLIDNYMDNMFVTATKGSYTHNNDKRLGVIASKYIDDLCDGSVIVNCPVDEIALVDMCCEKRSCYVEPLFHQALSSGYSDNLMLSINPVFFCHHNY